MVLHFIESGPTDADTLVLLHGGGVSGWSWDPLRPHLDGCHLLAPDLPEHGRSADAGPLTIGNAARQVADLICERAHGGKAHLVGLSLGAQVGLQLLADRPELVNRAMLSGALVGRPGERSSYSRPFFRGLLRLTLAAYMPFRNQRWLVRANMRGFSVPPEYEEPFAGDTRRLTTDAFLRLLEANQGFQLPAGLENARVPALLLAGQREVKPVFRSLRLLAEVMPLARACVVTGVGHNWNLEDPALFARTLRAWIEDRPLPEELRPL